MVRQWPAKPLSPVRIWVPPMLYVVSTPIGNLSDISFHAIEVLKFCDYILCEDTRRSSILLNHYKIKKPLKSYHKFNEISKQNLILEDLKDGKNIALISDAGTPGIADPGNILIKQCIDANIEINAIPGACAAIVALSLSGLNTLRFQFVGFLPRKRQELIYHLQEILLYPGTTICYESPNRLLKTLNTIDNLEPERLIIIAREMTKKFESIYRGTPKVLIETFKKIPKGEIVLLIAESDKQETWSLSIEEHVKMLESQFSLSRKEAIKLVANLRKVPKRLIYSKCNEI